MKKLLIALGLLVISFASFASYCGFNNYHRFIVDGVMFEVDPYPKGGKQFSYYEFFEFGKCMRIAKWEAEALQKQGAEMYYYHEGDTDYYHRYRQGIGWCMNLGPGWTNQSHLKKVIEATDGFKCWIY